MGTLNCKLFGHKFIGEKMEYDPHYLKLVETGLAGVRLSSDYHIERFRIDYCVRCGIDKEK